MTGALEAIVLAAGSGRRFGGGKLTSPRGDGLLLDGALEAAFAAPVRTVSVVWGADEEGVAFNAEGVGGLEPRAVRLLREELPCALAQAIPGFGRRKGHDRRSGFGRPRSRA